MAFQFAQMVYQINAIGHVRLRIGAELRNTRFALNDAFRTSYFLNPKQEVFAD